MPTFREWLRANRSNADRPWPTRPNYGIGQDSEAYYCPMRPFAFKPTAKRPGDLVLARALRWRWRCEGD